MPDAGRKACSDRPALRDDERVLQQRRAWLRKYEEGKLTLNGLRELAPLIAAAVEKCAASIPNN
jgi:hypothetical protein